MVEDTGFPSDVYYDKYGQLHFIEAGLVSTIILASTLPGLLETHITVCYTVICILFIKYKTLLFLSSVVF